MSGIEDARSHFLLDAVREARLGVDKGVTTDCVVLRLDQDQASLDLPHHDFVVDVHVERPSHGLDEIPDFRRSVDIQRLIPVHLGGEHQDAGKAGHVVCMRVGNEDARDFLPPQVQPPQADLRAFPAVEEEQLPFPPHENRGQPPARARASCRRCQVQMPRDSSVAVSYSGRSTTLRPSSGISAAASVNCLAAGNDGREAPFETFLKRCRGPSHCAPVRREESIPARLACSVGDAMKPALQAHEAFLSRVDGPVFPADRADDRLFDLAYREDRLSPSAAGPPGRRAACWIMCGSL